ncbi:MAG: hypothetical protein U0V73_10270 [Acidimicrobiia bacterium]
MSALPPLPDPSARRATRIAWQAVAEHVVSAARHAATGRIGLRAAAGGFATPPFTVDGHERRVGVTGAHLFVEDGDTRVEEPLTTVRAAATVAGIEPGAPVSVYTPTTPLDLDAPLVVDEGAAAALAAWYALGAAALDEIARSARPDDDPSAIELWPEHFDVGLAFGPETIGARGTFGASPGDEQHDEPYLYVTHWADVPADPYWNDTAFRGASVTYSALARTSDTEPAAVGFFERGVDVLRGSAS